VQGERADVIGSPEIFLAQLRQIERRQKGQAHLASVGVAGELQVDGELYHLVGVVGLVRQKNDGFIGGNAAQRLRQVGSFAQHVIHSGEPEAGAIALHGLRLVGQHLNVLRLQRARHVLVICAFIVIAQHRPQAVRSAHLPQQRGARIGGQRAFAVVAECRHGNKISGKHNQVRMKSVDHGDGRMQRMHGKKRIEVEVAEQGDGESVKTLGPAAKIKILPDDARTVGGDENGVAGQRERTRGGAGEKKTASCSFEKRQEKVILGAAAVCLDQDNANAAGDVPANSRFLTRASPEFGMTKLDGADSETERRLQIDPADGDAGRKWSALQAVKFVEERRT